MAIGRPDRVALLEVVPLEHARHRMPGGEPNQVSSRHGPHPGRVELHDGAGRVKNPVDLAAVRGGIGLDLVGVSAGRVAFRPDGSPISPVKSPIRKTTRWPNCWKVRSLLSRTVWPRCRSGAVGSKPALIVRGARTPAGCAAQAAGRTSTAPRQISSNCFSYWPSGRLLRRGREDNQMSPGGHRFSGRPLRPGYHSSGKAVDRIGKRHR
jgi:hypothetical protein